MLCFVAGMQIWKYAYPREKNTFSFWREDFKFKPREQQSPNTTHRQIKKYVALLLTVMGIIGLGVFPASKGDIYVAENVMIQFFNTSAASYQCVNMQCSTLSPLTPLGMQATFLFLFFFNFFNFC